MAQDEGLRVLRLQLGEQRAERVPLLRGAGVGRMAPGVQPALATDADGVGVVAGGMGPGELQVTCLVDAAAEGDVVVVGREAEPVLMVAYESRHREGAVAGRG